jgi:D-alanine transaminase
MSIVYLNGEFLEESKAQVSVLDRGFIFGDGVYEVIPSYGGHPFRIAEHLDRLVSNLTATRIPDPYQRANWIELIDRLIQSNEGVDQSVYLQITRGVARRDHAIPKSVTPTIFMMSNPLIEQSEENLNHGIAAITCIDNRWANCHIKAISLLANVLLKQQAIDVNTEEAILIRDGEVTEGTASNVFIVKDNVMITPPKGPRLLPGITRDLILELAQSNHLSCQEGDISETELQNADEIWITSSIKEVIAVTTLNEQPVGNGQPGPMWQQIYAYYQSYKQQLRDGGG